MGLFADSYTRVREDCTFQADTVELDLINCHCRQAEQA